MSHLALVALVVRDYQPAIDFFVDVLQFELVEDVPSLTNDGRPKRWVVVRPPGRGDRPPAGPRRRRGAGGGGRPPVRRTGRLLPARRRLRRHLRPHARGRRRVRHAAPTSSRTARGGVPAISRATAGTCSAPASHAPPAYTALHDACPPHRAAAWPARRRRGRDRRRRPPAAALARRRLHRARGDDPDARRREALHQDLHAEEPAGPLPIVFRRTPYGIDGAAGSFVRYYKALADDGYIFVFQDIRGKFKSEGTFVMQRPARAPGRHDQPR